MSLKFYAVILFSLYIAGCGAAEHRFRTDCVERYREPVQIEKCVKIKKALVFVSVPFVFGAFWVLI